MPSPPLPLLPGLVTKGVFFHPEGPGFLSAHEGKGGGVGGFGGGLGGKR